MFCPKQGQKKGPGGGRPLKERGGSVCEKRFIRPEKKFLEREITERPRKGATPVIKGKKGL